MPRASHLVRGAYDEATTPIVSPFWSGLGRRRGGRSRGPCLDRPVDTTANRVAGGGSAPRTQNGGEGSAPRPRRVIEQLAPLGEYTVTLQFGTTKLTRPARVTATQGWRIGPVPEVIR